MNSSVKLRSRHAKPRNSVVRNTVAISDTHSGCLLALYNPHERIRRDDGGFYQPSEFQEQMWALWEDFWNEWVPTATRGEPYDIVHNGDAIDGVHHGATTLISNNINDQRRIAIAVLRPQIERCKKMGGRYFHVRGTAAHVGQSSIHENEVAEALGAVPNKEGQLARDVCGQRRIIEHHLRGDMLSLGIVLPQPRRKPARPVQRQPSHRSRPMLRPVRPDLQFINRERLFLD